MGIFQNIIQKMAKEKRKIQMPNLFDNIFLKGEPPCSVFEVADVILGKLHELADTNTLYLPTNMKLQKLLYYVQGFHIGYYDSKLFADEFQAWANGPVVPSIYQKFKYYGTSVIPKSEIMGTGNKEMGSNRLISAVINEFGKITPYILSQLTHADGTAWKKTRKNYNLSESESSRCIIPDSFIKEEFKNKHLEGFTKYGL